MSLKPPKKSDLNKSWMKERRDKKIKMRPECHLIVTEGTDTEPEYFRAIKEVIDRQYPERIHLEIQGKGDNTLSLFEKARSSARKSPNGYRHVWVVYDTDSFPADHINRTKDLCDKYTTDETEYHAVWSNQCIELWFLLHFDFFQSDDDRKEYWPKLSGYLNEMNKGKYSKNRKDMFQILSPYMNTAIKNAKKLAKINEGKPPASAAPGTMVYELIERLQPYLG